MKNGECPKCGSDNVRWKRQAMSQGMTALQVTTWTTIYLDVYACGGCGYLESYLPADKLKLVNEKWERLQAGDGPIFDGH